MIECDEVHAGQEALRGGSGLQRHVVQQRTGGAVEVSGVVGQADAVAHRAADLDHGVGIAGVPHPDRGRRRPAPARARGLDHRPQRGHRCRHPGGRARVAGQGLVVEGVRLLVQRADAGRHQDHVDDADAGERNHRMERQRQHAGQVVQVQQAALQLLARPEREEVAEDADVDDHPRHDRRQHRHRRQAHQPVADTPGTQVQVVVQRIEE
ncbi:hypothetical protein D3C72_1226830 [compost metagenome]